MTRRGVVDLQSITPRICLHITNAGKQVDVKYESDQRGDFSFVHDVILSGPPLSRTQFRKRQLPIFAFVFGSWHHRRDLRSLRPARSLRWF
jgi:hypothetical protein